MLVCKDYVARFNLESCLRRACTECIKVRGGEGGGSTCGIVLL